MILSRCEVGFPRGRCFCGVDKVLQLSYIPPSMPTQAQTSIVSVFPNAVQFFKNLRWSDGVPSCIRCDTRKIYILGSQRLRCKECGLTFGDFTGTYLGQLNIPVTEVAHLLYLFALGLPVYRCRNYLTVSLKTAHRAYTIFRTAIYDHSIRNTIVTLKEAPEVEGALKSSFELDFCKAWGYDQTMVFFGLVVVNDQIHTFPISLTEQKDLIRKGCIKRNRETVCCSDQGYSVLSIPVSSHHLVLRKKRTKRVIGRCSPKVESFWVFLREYLFTYHGVDVSTYHLYIKEIEYRYNNRSLGLFLPVAELLTRPVPKSWYKNSDHSPYK